MLTPIVMAARVFVAPALDAADADEADQTRGADHVAESTRVERPYDLSFRVHAGLGWFVPESGWFGGQVGFDAEYWFSRWAGAGLQACTFGGAGWTGGFLSEGSLSSANVHESRAGICQKEWSTTRSTKSSGA